jgi:hypothetical protein
MGFYKYQKITRRDFRGQLWGHQLDPKSFFILLINWLRKKEQRGSRRTQILEVRGQDDWAVAESASDFDRPAQASNRIGAASMDKFNTRPELSRLIRFAGADALVRYFHSGLNSG